MRRWVPLALLGLPVVLGVLVALDVVPLGRLGGEDPATRDEAPDLLAGDGTPAAGTLHGRGRAPGEVDPSAPLTAGAPEPAPAAEVRGTTRGGAIVRGRVLRAAGRVPLAGMRVTLSRPDSLLAYLRARPNGRFDTLAAVTAQDGRFAFLDVTPSQGYVVRAVPAGDAQGALAVTSARGDLDLRGRETVDVGDLLMGPGGAITGRVLDHASQPVPGARVVATWRIGNPIGVILSRADTAPEQEREAQTDASGTFTLPRLEPGPKTVFAAAPTGARAVVRSVGVEAGATLAMADIVLPGPGGVAGRVQFTDGTPIPGARVFVGGAGGGATVTHGADTDAEGRFRIEWVPPEDGQLLGVLVPGLPLHLERKIEGRREDVLVELPVPGSITGRVVRARSGAPVARFGVVLDEAADGEQRMDAVRYMTMQIARALGPTPFEDEGGAFGLPRVAAGRYVLRVTSPGFPEVKVADVTVTPGQATPVVVEMPEGNVARGTVARADGAPAGSARLYVFAAGTVSESARGVPLTGYVNDREPDAASRPDGRFELPPQTPGRYDVIVAHEDTLPAVTRGVDLRAGDVSDLDLRLPPSGAVRGLLLDEHARPTRDEQVYILFRDGIVRLVPVGEDGRFEAKGLPVGRCVVRWLSMREGARYARSIQQGSEEDKAKAYDELRQEGGDHEVVDGGVVEVTLRMPRRVKVGGRVQLPDAPDERITELYANMPGAPNWIRIEVDADGRYARELEPGTYQVWVPRAGKPWQRLEIEIPDVPALTLDLPPR